MAGGSHKAIHCSSNSSVGSWIPTYLESQRPCSGSHLSALSLYVWLALWKQINHLLVFLATILIILRTAADAGYTWELLGWRFQLPWFKAKKWSGPQCICKWEKTTSGSLSFQEELMSDEAVDLLIADCGFWMHTAMLTKALIAHNVGRAFHPKRVYLTKTNGFCQAVHNTV